MKKIVFIIFFLIPFFLRAQLTVEQIMQDSKWIGTSPSDIIWSYDSKSIFFEWNPDKNTTDSSYNYLLSANQISKVSYINDQLAKDISNGIFNHSGTKIAFAHNGDIYLLTIAGGNIIRITQTAEKETDPAFSNKDSNIVYALNDNLFALSATGSSQQLTNFVKGSAPAENQDSTQQQQWLNNQALQTSSVMNRRKQKADSAKNFLEKNREEKKLRKIYLGTNDIQHIIISPAGRFITYRLYQKNDEVKGTIVPSYVTKDGYTKEIPARSKVGRPNGIFSFYIFDRIKDTVITVSADSIEGITDIPEYIKDYPAKYKDVKTATRKVLIEGPYWDNEGTACIVDILSLDNKDRWIMQLDAARGKLSLLDHQHDNAWIAGPGIAWSDAANIGWINANTIYFQSEATGFSHLYSYNISTHQRSVITQGKYEIQKAILSRDKKYFYVITNEGHPGKQNIYRINVDGSNKIKLTSLTGGYEMFLSPNEKYIAYRYSCQNKPWELYFQKIDLNTNPVQITDKAMSDAFKAYPWRDTKIFTFTARDGAQVYMRIYESKPGTKNNAAVIFVHGAGYLQNADYRWSYYFREMMFNNLLADKGYTIMDIDYRGSAGYGRDWRTGIYRYMGGKDLDDEVDAAHYLVQNLGIDSTRIGIYGGSYGGFITLMALFTQPNVFKAGAALRPVTDWAHYDHEYTSAILNEPFTDSIAYLRSSPINFADGLKNHLLICHGMVDENVHFQDAVRLSQRLIELGKDNWELAAYPVEDHSFIEPSSWTNEYKRILKLFNENLLK
ncbi:MAG: prolyl oligopeptidase family serine peptidase [Ginsengibacter sp.]